MNRNRILFTALVAGLILGNSTILTQATDLPELPAVERFEIKDNYIPEHIPLQSISMRSTLPLSALEEGYLEVTYEPADATNKNLIWSTSDSEIVSIDEQGNFKTLKKGKAVLTAVSEENPEISATCEVDVINNVKFCTEVEELQSAHPYENGYSDGWMYTMPGEKGLFVTFDSRSSLYNDSDLICVMDKDRNAYAVLTGKEMAGKKVEVLGDTLVIMMYTDAGRNDWGFKVSEVRSNTPIYNVKFNANGATSGSMSSLTGVFGGQSFELPAVAFKKSGYIFHGWNTKADGTGIDYADQATVSDLTTKDGKTVTLYAQWDKKLAITKQPQDVWEKVNSPISFQVEAEGGGLTYQWQYSTNEGADWQKVNADSAKASCLSLIAKAGYKGYWVRCVVRD